MVFDQSRSRCSVLSRFSASPDRHLNDCAANPSNHFVEDDPASEFSILLVLLSQVETIRALFICVPAVIVSARLVVHVEADAGRAPYSTSQGNHEDE
jgi:hypothetical protein